VSDHPKVPPHEPDRKFLISDLCNELERYLSPEKTQEVYNAYLFAAEAHEGQQRLTGEHYIYHPLQVARILAEMRLDGPTLCAALLHDVIEDTAIDKACIARLFGEQVAELVDGVSKLTSLEHDNPMERQAASFQKLILAMCRDIRVILIKLADRLHNARTWHVKKKRSRRRIARETLEIYTPIAMRLGLYQLAQHLEDLSFMALYPMRYRILRAQIDCFCDNKQRREIGQKALANIQERMIQANIVGEVIYEEKTPFYVYQKMRQAKSFRQIVSPFRFHAIVDSLDNCYRLLGQIHSLYKPKPGGFKDYIAIPKINGYQALHTKLIAAKGQPIEVHIRTQQMNQVAEFGIVSYGAFEIEQVSTSAQTRVRAWVQRLLELQRNTDSSVEFLDNVKIDLFPDDVYVFTPQGEIIELPRGATVLDFAYAVHSNLGQQAINARVDGQYASLSTILQNGQSIEIITANWAKPHLEWLEFAATAKARSTIRNYFKTLSHEEAVSLGARILARELARRNCSLEDISEEQWEDAKKLFHNHTREDLFREIGLGSRLVLQVTNQLSLHSCAESTHSFDALAYPDHTAIIQGAENLVVTLANCCRPIPGDPVIGHISVGRGLVVHTADCRNLKKQAGKENVMEVAWSDQVHDKFFADVRIEVQNRRGVLAKITTALTELGVNIEGIASEEKNSSISVVYLTLQVSNQHFLEKILCHLRTVDVVIHAERKRSASST